MIKTTHTHNTGTCQVKIKGKDNTCTSQSHGVRTIVTGKVHRCVPFDIFQVLRRSSLQQWCRSAVRKCTVTCGNRARPQ